MTTVDERTGQPEKYVVARMVADRLYFEFAFGAVVAYVVTMLNTPLEQYQYTGLIACFLMITLAVTPIGILPVSVHMAGSHRLRFTGGRLLGYALSLAFWAFVAWLAWRLTPWVN